MAYIYAPNHTIEDYMNHARQHVGHKLSADFTNSRGGHAIQVLTLEAYGPASNEIYISKDRLARWFPVSELWAYGTPQCLTCG